MSGIKLYFTAKNLFAVILFLFIVFDQQGGSGIVKPFALILIPIYLLASYLNQDFRIRFDINFWLFSVISFINIVASCITLARGGFNDSFIDTSYYTFNFYLILIFLISTDLDLFLRYFIIFLRVLSFCIMFALIDDLLTITGNEFIYYFVSLDSAFFGIREFFGIPFYYIFFVSSPLLIFLFIHDLYAISAKKSIFRYNIFLITLSSVILTGNRMLILLSALAFSCLFLIKLSKKDKRLMIIFIFMITVLSFVFITLGLSSNHNIEDIRSDFLAFYANIFSNFSNSIFGQGFNAHTWSVEARNLINPYSSTDHASKVELTYLEILRVYGVFSGAFFIIILILPVVNFFSNKGNFVKRYEWVIIGYLLYLFSALSNPTLISVLGALAYAFALNVSFLTKSDHEVTSETRSGKADLFHGSTV